MITYVDYSLAEVITQYKALLVNYPIIYYILGALVVFGLIILVNLNTKTSFSMTLISLVITIISIFYFRGIDMINYIDTIISSHFYQNIFFYYWNVIIGILIMHVILNSKNSNTGTKFITLIFYILTLANLVYSFYITNVVGNNYTLVVGNINPIIVLENILLFILYLYLIILKIVEACKKKR